MSERLGRLQAAVAGQDLDALVLAPGATLRYLTGTGFDLAERLFLLFVPRDGETVVVIPDLEADKWKGGVPFSTRLFPWADAEGPGQALASAAGALPELGRVGVEPLGLRFMELDQLQGCLPKVRIEGAGEVVEELRLIKVAEEIEAMRRAIEITERVLADLVPTIKIGMSERSIAARLASQLLGEGGEGIAFGPIVLSGPQSALPHGVPGERCIEAGDLLLLDFGTTVDGYNSDLTRTFVVGAEPDDRTREVYEAVRRANRAGRAVAGPGKTAHEVHHATQDSLHTAEFEAYYKHRTGHGLGLDIHEPPSIMDGNHSVLAPGTAFTIEPGLYLDGWGGVRIEDDVVVSEDGIDCLTRFPRQLQVIGLAS